MTAEGIASGIGAATVAAALLFSGRSADRSDGNNYVEHWLAF